jgi:hypothetical protein
MYPLVLVHDLRPVLPWSVYALPVDIPGGSEPQFHERRFAVKWDDDNDERVLGAVLAAYYASPESIWTLYAVGERKGGLTVYTQEVTRERMAAWQAAIRSHCIQDSWTLEIVDTYEQIQREGGLRFLERVAEGGLIESRHFSTEHDPLDALIGLFELGPTGKRREWKWGALS